MLDDLLAIKHNSGTTGALKNAMLLECFYWFGAKNAGGLSEANRNNTFFLWDLFYRCRLDDGHDGAASRPEHLHG